MIAIKLILTSSYSFISRLNTSCNGRVRGDYLSDA